MEVNFFSKYRELKPVKNYGGSRGAIIQEFVNEINKERPCTYKVGTVKKTLGLVSARSIAIKLGHLKNENELIYFLSMCKDYKFRNGSFSKCFFGSIKSK